MPMIPVRTVEKKYHTLEEIQKRKEELAADIQKDSDQFATLWNGLFTPRKDFSKGEWAANVISKSVTAIDAFLLARKLLKNYGYIFRRKKH